MFNKLKYIFTDFSDGFKRDFLSTLKRSIVFLLIGIIMIPLKDSFAAGELIFALGFLIFGMFWAAGLIKTITNAVTLPTSNIVLRIIIAVFLYVLGSIVGYIYFGWCIIKMLMLVSGKKIKDSHIRGDKNE